MPELHNHIYASSCNPPRRVKRAHSDIPQDSLRTPTTSPIMDNSVPVTTTAPAIQQRAILPRKPTNAAKLVPAVDNAVHDLPVASAPSKRGRKPGPLSRTAREAQRRLNHSIIEKARRTKINEALATLKELVPPDYSKRATVQQDDDSDDDEYDDASKKKAKGKAGGKREEKEKEFKLEILVRTVSYMQELLQRVAVLEQGAKPCPSCREKETKKRKRSQIEDDLDVEDQPPPRPKRTNSTATAPTRKQSVSEQLSPTTSTASPESRLPPISSWLHGSSSSIDPNLLPKSRQPTLPDLPSHLPSPPSSTHFDPVRTTQVPPKLNLGPVATAAMLSSSGRTPEDESAASLLLQISASSPTFRPMASSTSYPLADPSRLMLPSSSLQYLGPQTPASILGLTHPMK